MLRLVSLALAAVGLLVALGGCTRSGGRVSSAITPESPAAFTSTPAADGYPERITRWLSGIPCRAPCWEGITPGQTSRDEAVGLLGDNQFVDLPRFPKLAADAAIEWRWRDSDFGTGTIYTSDGTVSLLLAQLPEQVLLGDVIGAYGEPSHVYASTFMGLHGDGPFYTLALAWESAGFALDSGFLYHEKPVLGPDLGFLNLYVSPTPLMLQPQLMGNAAPQPWQGFKDFDAYCRDESGHTCLKK
jgi:hypothetical protein